MFFSDYNELLDRLEQSDVPFLDRLQLDVNFKDMCNHQTGIIEMTLLVIWHFDILILDTFINIAKGTTDPGVDYFDQ